MKNKGLLLPILLAGALLPIGCNRTVQQEDRTTQPAPQYYEYDGDYAVWVGPGWYYGIYFSNEGRYRDWRRRHWGRRYYYPRRRGYYYRWGRPRRRWDGRGRWRGGRGRGRGRVDGRGGRGRGGRGGGRGRR